MIETIKSIALGLFFIGVCFVFFVVPLIIHSR